MNYNKLNVFYEVAKRLNQTKAAEDLYLSQPTISRHIADLEADFGVALFLRTNKDLALTPAGEILLNLCDSFFPKEQEIYSKVRAAAKPEKSILRIAFMGLNTPLSKYKKRFLMVCDDSDLVFERIDLGKILSAVIYGDVDAGIIFSVDNVYPPEIAFYTIDRNSPGVVFPSDHPLAHLKSVSLPVLNGETFLLEDRKATPVQHNLTITLCEEAGFSPKIGGVYPNVETMLLMVQAGMGISILSGFAPLQGIGDITYVPLENAAEVFQDLIWKRETNNESLGKFIEMLQTDDTITTRG